MTRILFAAVVSLSLAACSQAQLAVTAARATLSAEQVAALASMCQSAAPMLRIASGPTMPVPLRETAMFGDAFCAEMLRGVLPAAADANSVTWLSRIVQVVRLAMG